MSECTILLQTACESMFTPGPSDKFSVNPISWSEFQNCPGAVTVSQAEGHRDTQPLNSPNYGRHKAFILIFFGKIKAAADLMI